MATYYVDFVNGNDSNNGLGPDASDGTNKPWKTIGKLLGASGMASGDTAYLSPAGPFREVVTMAMTSAIAETQVIGDPTNAQGFKTSGGVLVEPGEVIWTAYTTDDTTIATTTALLTVAGRDFMHFKNIFFIGGNVDPSIINVASSTVATNWTLTECVFFSSRPDSRVNRLEAPAGTDVAWVFDRCIFVGGGGASGLNGVSLNRHSADYDANILFRNCLFLMSSSSNVGIRMDAPGAGAGFGGGVDALNCTCYGGTFMNCTTGNLSTTIPCTVNNSLLISNGVPLVANTSGQITEDYNVIVAPTPRTNVTAGTNSVSGSSLARAPMLEVGQSWLPSRGRLPKPFLSPMLHLAYISPLLGFGSTGAPSVDLFNRPRPAGGQSTSNAAGAMEAHDTGEKETSTVDAGSTAIKIVGPGDQEIHVPVDAASTTISIRARYDATHDTTNKPQAILLANSEIGVSTETETMTSAADTWETLTFSAFTPTAKGWVTIRLVSRSAAGTGIAFFDTLVVA